MAHLTCHAAPFTGARVPPQQRHARGVGRQPLVLRAASSAAVPIKDKNSWTGEAWGAILFLWSEGRLQASL